MIEWADSCRGYKTSLLCARVDIGSRSSSLKTVNEEISSSDDRHRDVVEHRLILPLVPLVDVDAPSMSSALGTA